MRPTEKIRWPNPEWWLDEHANHPPPQVTAVLLRGNGHLETPYHWEPQTLRGNQSKTKIPRVQQTSLLASQSNNCSSKGVPAFYFIFFFFSFFFFFFSVSSHTLVSARIAFTRNGEQNSQARSPACISRIKRSRLTQ